MRHTLRTLSLLWVIVVAVPASALSQAVREGHSVTLNGIEIYYETVGEGEPLLLLHGWSGTGHDYDPFVEEFSRHYRLILPDMRGHGRSTNPGNTVTFSQLASDVFALLDHLGLDRVRAIGASMGGITLYHMATREPSRIERMIAIGAGSHFPPACKESMLGTTEESFPPEWWEEMRARHQHGEEQITLIANMLQLFAGNDLDAAFIAADFARITAPTLIVYGDQDWCFPTTMAADIYEAIPEAALWVVPYGPHVPITGPHQKRFTETALAFLGSR